MGSEVRFVTCTPRFKEDVLLLSLHISGVVLVHFLSIKVYFSQEVVVCPDRPPKRLVSKCYKFFHVSYYNYKDISVYL